MPLAEVMKFVELIANLVKTKSELNKNYYETFIHPVWETFVKVHENSKNSFREYADLVSNEDYPIESLVERIRQDSIYTSDLRSELSKLIKHLPSDRLKARNNDLMNFANSIYEYFFSTTDGMVARHETRKGQLRLMYYSSIENLPRYMVIVYLSRKGSDNGRDHASAMFTEIVQDLQSRFEKVADTHYHLRKTLLA